MASNIEPSVIGREEEIELLRNLSDSNQAEFIALYGRRRVGKTFLVRNYFSKQKNCLLFYVTGQKEGSLTEQLQNFSDEIGNTFLYKGAQVGLSQNWRNAFRALTDFIEISKEKRKIILFFDEFPWMATPKSRLLSTLEYYWNHIWSRNPKIKLIICGSSSSWILKNIVNNKAGLYNRVTQSIHLKPYTLYQTRQYLNHLKLNLNEKQIAQIYMILGGIPFYLSKLKANLTPNQQIEQLAFNKNSFLLSEFSNLYSTLFGENTPHAELVQIIAEKHYGISKEELSERSTQLSSGGHLKTCLKELQETGFILEFKPFNHKTRGVYYKVIDEYSLFYFHWILPIKDSLLEQGMRKGYWEEIQETAAWHSWSGYAFESLCYKHIQQISIALHLKPSAIPYAWRYQPQKKSSEDGSQIDLLFDRRDDAITICEIKYTNQPFSLSKEYAQKLQEKIAIFNRVTRNKKQCYLAIISANGLKKTMYSEELISEFATLLDLFKKA